MPRKRSSQDGRRHSAAPEPESEAESFDEFMRRAERAGREVPRRQKAHPTRTMLQVAQDSLQQRKEQCRRSLRDGVCFEDLEARVEMLPPLRLERWGRAAVKRGILRAQDLAGVRAILRAQDLADVWCFLRSGAVIEKGRTSDLPDRIEAAFIQLDDVMHQFRAIVKEQSGSGLDILKVGVSALRGVLEKRVHFPGLDGPDADFSPTSIARAALAYQRRLDVLTDITSEEFALAYQRLRDIFRPPQRANRPPAVWRSLTIALLRKTKVRIRDAKDLADLAGLTADARRETAQGRRRRAALQKRRERLQRRGGSENTD